MKKSRVETKFIENTLRGGGTLKSKIKEKEGIQHGGEEALNPAGTD